MNRAEYREVYLRSDHWREQRRDLTVLCRECHDLFHGTRSVESQPPAQKRPKKRPRGSRKRVKISCAYCRGKNGRHEHNCKRHQGERWWQEGIRKALEERGLR